MTALRRWQNAAAQVPPHPLSVRPHLLRLLAPGALSLSLLAGPAVLAQSPPPPPPAGGRAPARGGTSNSMPVEGPASQQDLYAYALIGAVNACELATKAKVSVQQGIPAAAQSVAFVISRRHGGRVQGIDKPLTPEQMFDGSAVQITVLVRQGCYSQLSAADKKLIDTSIAQIQAARNQKR